jgi:glycosyltransferase involved in cell wall biosynthesis
MAAQIPVVGARAGGLPECIVDGDTGYLVDPEDKTTFVERLRQLLDDQPLRENFGIAARKAVESYSPEQIARRFTAVYRKAINLSRK